MDETPVTPSGKKRRRDRVRVMDPEVRAMAVTLEELGVLLQIPPPVGGKAAVLRVLALLQKRFGG